MLENYRLQALLNAFSVVFFLLFLTLLRVERDKGFQEGTFHRRVVDRVGLGSLEERFGRPKSLEHTPVARL